MSDKFYEKYMPKKAKTANNPKNQKKTAAEKPNIDKKTNIDRKTNIDKKAGTGDRPAYTPVKSNCKVVSHKPLFQTDKVPQDAKRVIEDFDLIIQGVKPLNSKQLQQLPDNIRNLSHQMTDDRSTRRLGYMNENVQLSAYVRYFTWWNLVRLSRLFSNLPEECFPTKDCVCLDLGSGPLTVVTALWLARPELREKNLTWYCLDVSQNSLSLGEDIFLSVAARVPGKTWKIIRVKGSFGTYLKEKAEFITCANMFNELDQASDMPPEYQTKKYYDQLKNYGTTNTKYLLIEPGVPKAARTLSLLRDRFIKDEYAIPAPCPHYEDCPMNGFKAYTGSASKWCNFAFNTEDAPKKLQALSTHAKLPKERAVLSFISAIPGEKAADEKLTLRIASDSFKLPGYFTGHYACSKLGLTLVSSKDQNILSGDLLQVDLQQPEEKLPVDEKSGAKKLVL